eukprot:COSAG02_NODE_64293_length_261_cov_0.537037_1_plen_22_part_10
MWAAPQLAVAAAVVSGSPVTTL